MWSIVKRIEKRLGIFNYDIGKGTEKNFKKKVNFGGQIK